MGVLDTIQIIIGVCFALVFIFVLAYLLQTYLYPKDGKGETSDKKGCMHLIICVFLVLAAFFVVSMCTGGLHRGPWEPRHTYIQKPILNNVNSSINMQELLQR